MLCIYFWKFSTFIWVKFIQKQQKYPKKKTEFYTWASYFIMNYKLTVKYMFWRKYHFQDALHASIVSLLCKTPLAYAGFFKGGVFESKFLDAAPGLKNTSFTLLGRGLPDRPLGWQAKKKIDIAKGGRGGGEPPPPPPRVRACKTLMLLWQLFLKNLSSMNRLINDRLSTYFINFLLLFRY